MSKFRYFFRWSWTFLVAVTLTLGLAGCEGDDGAAGATGASGASGSDGADGQACWDLDGNGVGDVATEDINGDGVVDVADCSPGADPVAAAVAQASPESCSTCHEGAGEFHQGLYDQYVDASAFEMTFTSFTTVPGATAGTFDATLELTIQKDGVPFTDWAGLGEKTFIVVDYDSTTNEHMNGRKYLNDTETMVSDGNFVITEAGLPFDPTVDGLVYGYIAQTPLYTKTGQIGGEIPTGSHVELYDDVANAALAFGDSQAGAPNAYESVANVEGCELCHGTPYLKHGFRAAEVDGLDDFVACKTCHYAGRNGFLSSLQYQVDDPFAWATGVAPTADYTYEGSIVNDTHMSHAMEFPYPQSMSNCSTCHAGKLTEITNDSYFTAETCKSCHAIQGIDAWPGEKYYQGNRPVAFEYLWTKDNDLTFHDSVIGSTAPDACTTCHGAAGIAPGFSAYHNGYDPTIYDENGVKWADQVDISIDQVTRDGNLLTINFSSTNFSVVPEVLVSFYGWDTKHFIVGSHERDANVEACGGRRPGCKMEYVPESSGGSPNPLFTEDPASMPGAWMVTLDMAALQLTKTDDLPTLIADGVIKKAEISITPELELGGVDVVLEAIGETFDLGGNMFVADYFKDGEATVELDKCNACHDAMASSFHDGSGRGGDGIEVCKHCHTTTFPGSHVEMASRSIDNYVHAIHSFQDFDPGDTFEEFDPVLAKRYDQHVNHVFPNFTIRNCEACHVEGTYESPSQAESMFSVASSSDDVATWYELVGGLAVEDPAGRSIGTVPEYVMGPASRACGGCHRARLIRDDASGELVSWNAHTESFGTYVENDEEDAVLFGIIDKIMSLFE